MLLLYLFPLALLINIFLPGHFPSVTFTWSMATSPVYELPVIPSNIIYKQVANSYSFPVWKFNILFTLSSQLDSYKFLLPKIYILFKVSIRWLFKRFAKNKLFLGTASEKGIKAPWSSCNNAQLIWKKEGRRYGLMVKLIWCHLRPVIGCSLRKIPQCIRVWSGRQHKNSQLLNAAKIASAFMSHWVWKEKE